MLLLYQEVFIWSVSLAFITAFLYRVLTNPNEIRALKKSMEELRSRMSQAQKSGNDAEAKKYMDEMLKAQQSQFRQNMKHMFASFIVFALFLYVFSTQYHDITVLSPFTLPFIGSNLGWFWWYFFIILGSNLLFRKLLAVD